MPGPLPKPDAERRRTNAPTFAWVDLPKAGRKGRPPAMPKWRTWQKATSEAWVELWKKPQATQWDQTGQSLHRWLVLLDDIHLGKAPTSVHAQLQAIEDRHGLSPAAMLKMRWRIVDDVAAPRPVTAGSGKRPARSSGGSSSTRRAKIVNLFPDSAS